MPNDKSQDRCFGPHNTLDLAGDPFALTTSQPHTRGLVNSYGILSQLIPAHCAKKLSDIALSLDVTFCAATCAAFYVLLHRYTGRSDILLGLPRLPVAFARHLMAYHSLAHQASVEIHQLIGTIAKTFALRVRANPLTPFSELLASIGCTPLGHQPTAGNSLTGPLSSINVSLDGKQGDPFEVLFLCTPVDAGSAAAAQAEPSAHGEVQIDTEPELILTISQNAGEWRATATYANKSYDEVTVGRLLGHYSRLLDEFATNPTKSIGKADMLTDNERQQLLVQWNQTRRSFPASSCVHELFEAQVRLNPRKVAVIAGRQTITYGELDDRANQLADALRSRGVGPDVLVGLSVDRSIDLIVGLVGILKSGGAYVPIDPMYPSDRISFVLEDSAASVVVTQRALLSVMPVSPSKCLLIDELANSVNGRPERAPKTSSESLAYVLYTSGSTGKPKGVQISHRSLVNFLHAMQREPGLRATDVLLAVTTLSFDISGLELHLPLITGATIILAPWEVAADGEALLHEIEEHNVTVLQATPATWRLMLAAGWQGTPSLKALCGGEAMPRDLAAALLPRCSELWNMYGPTETTIWSTCSRITNADDIHIGRPIDNTEVFILDSNHQPLPVGHAGELLIGGEGLARGYLNRHELTEERFIAHPFKTGQRLYRTGDLAKFRADGVIDCLGRLDHQVKIRGFRIELGEIENHLADHPTVAQNVVVAREEAGGDKRLIAYVVPREGASISPHQLRDHLRRKLPDYMLPAAFVSLAALPLTPNGKIDRKTLPVPAIERPLKSALRPLSFTQERLVRIFQSVLGIEAISIDESFFDLGGHSLLAAQLMQGITAEFGQRFPLAQLFEASTVAKLAALLDGPTMVKQNWDSLVPIQPREGRPKLFLVHGAGGNILLYRELVLALGSEVSVFGFQSQGLDGVSAPHSRIEEMAARYVGELRAFQPEGPYYIGGYCMGGSVAYEIARILIEGGQTVGLVALLDTYNFNLAKETSHFSFFTQKLRFHLENLSKLKMGDLAGYISEKMRMAKEVALGLIGAPFKSLNKDSTGWAKEFRAQRYIQKVNDQAALDFVPKPMKGTLTVFRPRKQYDFMPDPKMGWADLVSGRLEIVELPVNPHAMLLDPSVKILAQELRDRMVSSGSDTRAQRRS